MLESNTLVIDQNKAQSELKSSIIAHKNSLEIQKSLLKNENLLTIEATPSIFNRDIPSNNSGNTLLDPKELALEKGERDMEQRVKTEDELKQQALEYQYYNMNFRNLYIIFYSTSTRRRFRNPYE